MRFFQLIAPLWVLAWIFVPQASAANCSIHVMVVSNNFYVSTVEGLKHRIPMVDQTVATSTFEECADRLHEVFSRYSAEYGSSRTLTASASLQAPSFPDAAIGFFIISRGLEQFPIGRCQLATVADWNLLEVGILGFFDVNGRHTEDVNGAASAGSCLERSVSAFADQLAMQSIKPQYSAGFVGVEANGVRYLEEFNVSTVYKETQAVLDHAKSELGIRE
jgi:hypothetical protein